MSSMHRLAAILLSTFLAILAALLADDARAVGVLYSDPGWLHAFDGDSAYYHDPDGPHPDYQNGGDTNEPGGKSDFPALIDVGPCGTSQACKDMAIWQYRGSEWEGSAPGDPLGGAPNPYGTLVPPVSPPAPGGVGAYAEGSTNYIRIQDPGLPNPYGWADKNAQLSPTSAKQEGNNRRIEFAHQMSRDAGFSGTDGILDAGVTLSVRMRIATAATGPLDMFYSEDGPAASPWPTDGLGYPVANNGRGMIMISQGSIGGATSPGRVAFSLLDDSTVAGSQGGTQPITLAKRGLVMNSRSNGTASPDTNEATAASGNVVEIPNADLDEFHEFWITIKALAVPVAGNTHEVNVYRDGSLTPETFQIILANQNEAGNGSYLGMGLSSGSRGGAFDLDFIAYKEGVHVPTLVPQGLAGDYNDNGVVDAADYVLWRKNNNTNNPLTNDDNLGTPITTAHYDLWKANFGQSSPGSGGGSLAAVPEPSAAVLAWLLTAVVGVFTRRARRPTAA